MTSSGEDKKHPVAPICSVFFLLRKELAQGVAEPTICSGLDASRSVGLLLLLLRRLWAKSGL